MEIGDESKAKAKAMMDEHFESIKACTLLKEVESRVRFRLLDLEEMRQRNWERRKVDSFLSKEQPMTDIELKRKFMLEEAWLRQITGGPRPASKREALRTGRLVLNQISSRNVESCFTRLVDAFGSDRIADQKEFLNCLFNMATREELYTPIFADLCKRLRILEMNLQEQQRQDDSKKQPVSFLFVLYKRCRYAIETPLKVRIDQARTRSLTREGGEARAVEKVIRRFHGAIRFLGEMFETNLLHPNNIHWCIKFLLDAALSSGSSGLFAELLGLSELMGKVGKKLDSACVRNVEMKAHMNEYFLRIEKLTESKEIPSRVRFRLLDIVELRQRNWNPREIETQLQQLAQRPQRSRPVRPSGSGRPPVVWLEPPVAADPEAATPKALRPDVGEVTVAEIDANQGLTCQEERHEGAAASLVAAPRMCESVGDRRRIKYDRSFLLSLRQSDLSLRAPQLPGDFHRLLVAPGSQQPMDSATQGRDSHYLSGGGDADQPSWASGRLERCSYRGGRGGRGSRGSRGGGAPQQW